MTRGEQYRRAQRDLVGKLNELPSNDDFPLNEEAPMLHDKIRDFFQFYEPGNGFENTFLGFLNLLADGSKLVIIKNFL